MKIGLIIKSIRTKRDITLEQMAFDVNVATSTLSRIEMGKRSPSIELLERIAVHLAVPISDIFRAAEGHPITLDSDTRHSPLLKYTEESMLLMTEIQDVPARNTRLITELAKVINKELGGSR